MRTKHLLAAILLLTLWGVAVRGQTPAHRRRLAWMMASQSHSTPAFTTNSISITFGSP